MENKRKSVRVTAFLVASFKVKNTRLAGGSRVKDISETGACVPSNHYFPVDSLIELEIRSDDLKEPIKALARVVRITNRNDGKFPYEVGLVFLDLPLVKRNILHDYIQRSIAQEGNKDIHWLD